MDHKVEQWPVDRPIPYERNSRTHSAEQIQQIADSIEQFGFTVPLLVTEDGVIIAGHGRLEAAKVLGMKKVPVMVARGWTDEQIRAYVIADNKLAENAGWDQEMLRVELAELQDEGFDLSLLGFDASELDDLLQIEEELADSASDGVNHGSLLDRFGVAPFSVLNARDGWWQDRKRAWIALGIRSELGRGEVQSSMASARGIQKQAAKAAPGQSPLPAADYSKSKARGDGTGKAKAINASFPQDKREDGSIETWVTSSIFDPVLCELAYRWLCPPEGVVLDPFAGGSVRGIVASRLGRRYVGIDLSEKQLEANREQAEAICGDPMPDWRHGDSKDLDRLAADVEADLIFSCPPYADLEVYSDDPRDLSTMRYDRFREAYKEIIANAAARLRDNRFACFVVGDLRDKKGNLHSFPWHTIEAFEAAGLHLYNEAVLVTAIGSLPVRTGRMFEQSRKMGKTHQNVLIFVKGDPRKAAAAIGPVDFGDIEEAKKIADKEVSAEGADEFGEVL